jgi:hypothetical protein
MRFVTWSWVAVVICVTAVSSVTRSHGANPVRAHDEMMVGGANSPSPGPPQRLVIPLAEFSAGSFSVQIPTGTYTAPAGGAPNYAVPGPIVAFKGADGVWRGHGYLETYPRLVKFEGKVHGPTAELLYSFEGDKRYSVHLTATADAILMEEHSNLGPRNLFVFDCFYGQWLPASAFALDLSGRNHAFLYLPCFYDKPEVTINPAADTSDAKAGAVAVLSADPAKTDIAGFWVRDPGGWRNGDTMGIQLWQRRQLPGDPSSRHFQAPETKSDSTPNPRTADLLGQSLYEGHVTIEFSLGAGTRKLGFAATRKADTRETLPDQFKKIVQENP